MAIRPHSEALAPAPDRPAAGTGPLPGAEPAAEPGAAPGAVPGAVPGAGRRRWALVAAAGVLAGALALESAVIAQPGPLPGPPAVLYLALAWWAVAALGTWLLVRAGSRRATVWLLLAGAVAVHVLAIGAGPRMSDDLYRYSWDGRVQAAGIDPYRHPTSSPELAHLRDAWLWPDDAACAEINRGPGCTRLNYPQAHTIYPPVAQAYFAVVHYLPGPPRENKVQLYGGLVSLALTGLLVRVLAARGHPVGYAAAYAWAPSAGLDAGMDAHVDVLAALFAVGACALLARRPPDPARPGRPWLRRPPRFGGTRTQASGAAARIHGTGARVGVAAGALLGAAVAVKLYPALLLVAAARRRALTVGGTAVAVVALSYLPHVLAVGPDVVGFLPRYLSVEGYQDGHRFLLLGLLGLSGTSAKIAAALVLAAVAAAVWRADPARVGAELGALWLLGAAFLLATPAQPWYGIPLVALAVLARRPEWLAVAAAPYVLYMALFTDLALADRITRPGGYVVGALVVLGVSIARVRGGRREASGRPARPGTGTTARTSTAASG
ncbi:glycosyltransferase 87 family protein [Frankia sp. Cpl3]|uniref:glycosyltransferase 87 family protein n=1 Tax=Parafrankia colletiae TaxID=573497 RepID=UPI001F517936|nr:glycosyltransferase 87 family protein [Parafrankia colletiae]MCK9899069.1 glycosyltransferase 87 family protein [Frankia sp. Cpl3]